VTAAKSGQVSVQDKLSLEHVTATTRYTAKSGQDSVQDDKRNGFVTVISVHL